MWYKKLKGKYIKNTLRALVYEPFFFEIFYDKMMKQLILLITF